ncbi:ABC transporter permease [Marinobacterium sp. AK62]|uniref:Transport permease protein n=1 Tax=Marinobacterium alkalitolerans TaxID=1542925 RepID=A0ABS3ZDE1_9GAMM|nr:ABC transporter permease [Marinobacterium alkalitolerans]
MQEPLAELWRYRGFVQGHVKREFKARYQESLLGALWAVLNPLAMITIYTLVFSQVMRAKLPGVDGSFGYSVYLCAGIITWGLFADLVLRLQRAFLEHGALLKKVKVPVACLPVLALVNALVNFLIVFALFLAFLLLTGNLPGVELVALVPLLLLQLLFSIGLGMTLGILHVFFRDVGELLGVILQFWFWLTPIIYPAGILPDFARDLLHFNPLSGLMAGYQSVLVHGEWPDWAALWPVFLAAVVFCFLALRLYRKQGAEIQDQL